MLIPSLVMKKIGGQEKGKAEPYHEIPHPSTGTCYRGRRGKLMKGQADAPLTLDAHTRRCVRVCAQRHVAVKYYSRSVLRASSQEREKGIFFTLYRDLKALSNASSFILHDNSMRKIILSNRFYRCRS